MGIQGLLPLLKPIENSVHISEFNGEKVGVDAYVWLHRAAFSCALYIVLQQHKEEDKENEDSSMDPSFIRAVKRVVDYCVRKTRLLSSHGVTPVLVFDGGYLPSKAQTEVSRREKRRAGYEKVQTLLKSGLVKEATEEARKCVDITPRLAITLMDHLKQQNIECIVAPYEADAQLAYLQKTGHISAIITEDSDLLVFGCDNVIYKMDNQGKGIMLSASKIGHMDEFRNWTPTLFRHMCILSGCDYAASLPGIGLRKAMKLLKSKKDGYCAVKDWIKMGRLIGAPDTPPEYLEIFTRADLTFLHQRVYNPISQTLEYLSAPPKEPTEHGYDLTTVDFIGPPLDTEMVILIATGQVDPITKKHVLPFGKTTSISSASRPPEKPKPRPNEPIDKMLQPFTERLHRPPIPLNNAGPKESKMYQYKSSCQSAKPTKASDSGGKGSSLDIQLKKPVYPSSHTSARTSHFFQSSTQSKSVLQVKRKSKQVNDSLKQTSLDSFKFARLEESASPLFPIENRSAHRIDYIDMAKLKTSSAMSPEKKKMSGSVGGVKKQSSFQFGKSIGSMSKTSKKDLGETSTGYTLLSKDQLKLGLARFKYDDHS